MILIGDKIVPYDEIIMIKSIEDIKNTKANSIVSFGYNEKTIKYTFNNDIESAVIVDNIKDAIYSNALNAKYIIAKKDIAKTIQKIAENYMFDSKILAIIDTENEIEEIANLEIDGIIYSNLIISDN